MSLKKANLNQENRATILEMVGIIIKSDSDNLEFILGYDKEGVFVEFIERVYFANTNPEFILEFPRTCKTIKQVKRVLGYVD